MQKFYTFNHVFCKAVKLVAFLCFLMVALQAKADTYYYSSGNLDKESSWSSINTGGAPANFTNAADVFVINQTLSMNKDLIVSGTVAIQGAVTIPANKTLSAGSVIVWNGGTLTISNLTVPTLGTPEVGSTIIFDASGAQNVPALTYHNLTIGGSGTKTLQGNATVNGVLNFTGSNLTTANTALALTLGSTATITNEVSTSYYIGKLIKTATINTTGSTTFGGMGLTFNNTGGGNWGSVTVTRTTGSSITNPKDDTKKGIKRSWNIAPTTQAGTNVNMTYQWFTTEDNGLNFSGGQAQAWKSEDNGATWQRANGLVAITTNGTVRSLSLSTTSFSIWTFTDPITPLPVSWLYFNAKGTEKGNNLTWATASEKNSEAFIIERSANGKSFEAIGTVKAAGNSNQILRYQFNDETPMVSSVVYYRLKQTDVDGKFEYSTIVALAAGKEIREAVQVYPNPFAEEMNLRLPADKAVNVVVLKTVTGQEVYRKAVKSAAEVELKGLPALRSGMYLLELIGENGTDILKVMHR